MSDYLLDAATELERLQLQARIFEPEADALFARSGVRREARAIDVGCGAYGVLAALARAVGNGGRVVGLGSDDNLLAAARRHLDGDGIAGVELVHGDAFATGFPDGSFDVAHARFLLAPLGRPRELIAEMIRIVRPGGLVLLEEPDSASWRMSPSRPRVEALIAAIARAFARGGRTRLLDGIVSAHELDVAIADCEVQARDAATFGTSFVLVQAWGKKRQDD